MNYFNENLKETIEAINRLIDRKIRLIDVKKIRKLRNISSSDRSKINLIWRSLKILEEEGFIESYSRNSLKVYKILCIQKINVKEFFINFKKNNTV